ncbi:MAG: SagB/ThcOx family dehydrogenase [Candidatus Levybacteria bacterium]|nr:SagB/ThcOx family dehydrogenase [Candidatus Levybacteria bacterium]
MKNKTTQMIKKLEHQYRPYSSSEKFHEVTNMSKKGKTTPESSWPQTWKTIYTKGYPRLNSIKLTKKFSSKIKTPFDQVLYERRSTRDYKSKLLTIKELSTLLYFTSGVKPLINNNWDSSKRFYPSGGGRFPLETYIVLYNNTELKAGIYHYNVRHHSLEILKEGNYLKELQECLAPLWLPDANMAILNTAVFGRNQVKYGDRGYRFILNEAGHLAQNIYLIASALGLGCCALGGYIDSSINDLLDIDGINESAIYATVVGYPKK